MSTLRQLASTFRYSWHLILLWGVLFAVFMQFLQLALLILRFGDFPNYVIEYNWVSNVLLIFRSTPAVGDMLPIMFEEWWIEVGYMNYAYGNGISEWSLNIIPSRLVMLTFLGGMLTLLVILLRAAPCNSPSMTTAAATAGLGTAMMCMTSAAMSWVVCCATPSWVVGLAMLGLGVSTSLALENHGPNLFFLGFSLLSIALISVSRKLARNAHGSSVSEDSTELRDGYQYPTAVRRV